VSNSLRSEGHHHRQAAPSSTPVSCVALYPPVLEMAASREEEIVAEKLVNEGIHPLSAHGLANQLEYKIWKKNWCGMALLPHY